MQSWRQASARSTSKRACSHKQHASHAQPFRTASSHLNTATQSQASMTHTLCTSRSLCKRFPSTHACHDGLPPFRCVAQLLNSCLSRLHFWELCLKSMSCADLEILTSSASPIETQRSAPHAGALGANSNVRHATCVHKIASTSNFASSFSPSPLPTHHVRCSLLEARHMASTSSLRHSVHFDLSTHQVHSRCTRTKHNKPAECGVGARYRQTVTLGPACGDTAVSEARCCI